MPKAKNRKELPDIQETIEGFPKKAIKKVGTRNVLLPIGVKRQDGSINYSTANISLYCDLNNKTKGVNMSRFRILLEELILGNDILLDQFIRELMEKTVSRLEVSDSFAKIKFDYFLVKEAPVSKTPAHLHIPCVMEGRYQNGATKLYLTVKVPYSSLCPCSKEISDYGAHNQPSEAEIKVELVPDKMCWIEELVTLVESVASAPIRNVLKREDEAWQTELMYENPKFVEDMIREISVELDKKIGDNIADYSAVVNHFESIHQQYAVAVISAGKQLE